MDQDTTMIATDCKRLGSEIERDGYHASTKRLNHHQQQHQRQHQHHHQWYYFVKLLLLSICLLSDLILNGTSEYDDFEHNNDNDHYTNNDTIQTNTTTRIRIHKIHILLCSIQLLSQMSSFTILFSLLCDTFPFQIGLIGALIDKFTSVLWLQFIYLILTFAVSGIRMSNLKSSSNMTMLELWDTNYYTILSFIHKLVAPFYYAESFKASIELGSFEYYSKNAWSEKCGVTIVTK